MQGLLVLLATLAVAAAAGAGGLEPGLRVKFDMGTDPSAGESYFYNIPKSVPEARAEGWKLSRRPSGPLPQLVMYCYPDKVLCGLYDDTDYIAGLQVALAKSEFSKNVFDWKKRGFTSWNTAVDGECKRFWTVQQYFVDEEFLARSKEERLASRDSSRTLQAGAIWLTGIDKKLERVSTKEEDIVNEQVFTKQACLDWMGQHYYYNMTTTTECTDDQIYPWFPMTTNGELIASGFLTFGSLELYSERRDWFERPAAAVVQAIVPIAPQCVYDYATDPGAVTMHIYYVNQPWTITC